MKGVGCGEEFMMDKSESVGQMDRTVVVPKCGKWFVCLGKVGLCFRMLDEDGCFKVVRGSIPVWQEGNVSVLWKGEVF